MSTITLEDFRAEVDCDCGKKHSFKCNHWRELYEAAVDYFLMMEGQKDVTDETERLKIKENMADALCTTKLSNDAEWRERVDRMFSEVRKKL